MPTPWETREAWRFVPRGILRRYAVLQVQEQRRNRSGKTVYRYRDATFSEALAHGTRFEWNIAK